MKKLIISTDIGTDVDDAIAVYLAATHPDIELRGVWVTNGDVQTRALIAQRLLKLSKKKVPVFIGEAEAYSGMQPFMHGYEKDFVEGEKPHMIWQNGLDAVLNILENEKDIEIASIGPMTNLARLLREAPEAAKKIKRVYAMACRENQNEHNIRYDVPAAVEVFNSQLPITIVSGDVCDKYLLDGKPLLYETPEVPAVEYIGEMAMAWKLYHVKPTVIDVCKKLDERMVAALGGAPKKEVDAFFAIKEGLHTPPQSLDEVKNRIFHLNAITHKYPELADLKAELDSHDPKLFAVHDAYAIFCITNPESVKTKPCEARIDAFGHTTLAPYDKHEWVTMVDYDKFKEFLYKGLHLS